MRDLDSIDSVERDLLLRKLLARGLAPKMLRQMQVGDVWDIPVEVSVGNVRAIARDLRIEHGRLFRVEHRTDCRRVIRLR